MKVLIYLHGLGGSIEEIKHYQSLLEEYEVIGFDYRANTPWQAKDEFNEYFKELEKRYDHIEVLANSIGAYFALCSLNSRNIDCLYLISPIVNMEDLIMNMMKLSDIDEETLKDAGEIKTKTGDVISYYYLCYVRNHPVEWDKKTYVLYGKLDAMTSIDVIKDFCIRYNAELTVMEKGEHWFHTDVQMMFLDEWLVNITHKKRG